MAEVSYTPQGSSELDNRETTRTLAKSTAGLNMVADFSSRDLTNSERLPEENIAERETASVGERINGQGEDFVAVDREATT